MAVDSQSATDAKRNQVPPTLRRFTQQHCDGVRRLERFREEFETVSRGWKIEAERVRAGHLPDGFAVKNITPESYRDTVRVQVREE